MGKRVEACWERMQAARADANSSRNTSMTMTQTSQVTRVEVRPAVERRAEVLDERVLRTLGGVRGREEDEWVVKERA